MNAAKIMDVAHRIRITPPAIVVRFFLAELTKAIDEGGSYYAPRNRSQPVNHADDLRAMLNDEGVRESGRALATVARIWRGLR